MDLINFLFEATYRCNHTCPFCYNVWKDSPNYPTDEMSLDQIKDVFDRALLGMPTNSIAIGGGEPLLRDDLEEIVAYFNSKKFIIYLSTNGTLLDEARTRSLMAAGTKQFEITLLSADRTLHDKLTGHPGSFDKACHAIMNARKAGARVVRSWP